MEELDGYNEDLNIPKGFREVGQSIENFVRVNYETALSIDGTIQPTPEDIAILKGKIQDIIRNNPPFKSIPNYYREGREDYLWYSDFYDDISKEDYHRYQTFTKTPHTIISANYTSELAKIDLPYFRELIDLISLERLLMTYEENIPSVAKEIISGEDIGQEKQPEIVNQSEGEKPTSKVKQTVKKRSYEPKLNKEEYTLLLDCIETIELFRTRISSAQLKKLFLGKLTMPLQVTNQKSLVYLLDKLSEHTYIRSKWIAVAAGNGDFMSFRTEGNKQRYGEKPHFITTQQFSNSRNSNKREAIKGFILIEEMIERMLEIRNN